ncbi:MAG: hypothetical protein ACYT04_36505 [Nostoc sp.]
MVFKHLSISIVAINVIAAQRIALLFPDSIPLFTGTKALLTTSDHLFCIRVFPAR